MFVKPYIAVKQGGGAVNALPWGLVLDRDYIAVAVGLYARIRQAPFQNRVVVIVDLVRRNPCKLTTPPKVDTKPAEFLDEQQCHTFLQALHEQNDFQFEVICNLFLATGMRSGELCALHWDDIDLDTWLLYIQHTLILLDGEFRRDTPKTSGSER